MIWNMIAGFLDQLNMVNGQLVNNQQITLLDPLETSYHVPKQHHLEQDFSPVHACVTPPPLAGCQQCSSFLFLDSYLRVIYFTDTDMSMHRGL